MLIKMIDGGIKDIHTEEDFSSGCETCDFGRVYVNTFTVYLTKGEIEFEISNTYDYVLSQDYMLKLFLRNVDAIRSMAEKEFFSWLKDKLEMDFKDKVDGFEWYTTLK